uniref:Methyltransferase n=1 Tax=viral metagenome TaxID=1070528 RepID=A0A6C0E1S9_9ZZZZ
MPTRLICARYNENINWLLPLKDDLITVYNKGPDDLHLFPKDKIVKLENLGREGGTYLYHIIQNYDKLDDYTIFIQGNPVDHVFCREYQRSYNEIFTTFKQPKSYDFKYISKHFIRVHKDEITNYTSGIPSLGIFVDPIPTKEVIKKTLQLTNLPEFSEKDISLLVDKLKQHGDMITMYELSDFFVSNKSFMSNDGHNSRRLELYSLFDTSILEIVMNTGYEFGYGALFVASKKAILKYPKQFWENIYSTFQSFMPASGWGLEKFWRLILTDEMDRLKIIKNIPNIGVYPLCYVFEKMKLKHKENTLWLEFGVASGRTINYISTFTSDKVYGFDSFEGLPEKWRDGFDTGAFNLNGNLPQVNSNVVLLKGWFDQVLPSFIKYHNNKISFIHIDCDLYSSTKYILNTLKHHLEDDCVVVFDELVNYPGFNGDTGELKAFYEFVTENKVNYEWIGMNGVPFGMTGYPHENVAVIIHSVN